ncbi:hypothetical protein ACFE04_015769 [Oxalis oulophora]
MFTTLLVTIVTFICLLLLLSRGTTIWKQRQNGNKLPPGPRSLPIIGNLHMLGALPHRSLAKLAQKYGPIMSLKLGQVRTIVVTSPQAAELFLKTHDIVFASRPKSQASEIMSYGAKGIALTPYGSYWRNIRKVCTLELLTASKIGMFAPMRKEEVWSLVEEIKEAAMAHEIVDLTKIVNQVVENITYRMILGRKKDDEFDLKSVISSVISLAGTFNLSDYVPYLAPFDIKGLAKRMKAVSKSAEELLEKIISDHEKDKSDNLHQNDHYKDFVDVLLTMLHQPMDPKDEHSHIIDKTNIKATMLGMLAASLDTTSTVIDWTLAELLTHPHVMTRLQEELECVIGNKRVVEENDLVNLPYFDMVIKESLRLHPALPLLIPHESMEDITIDGFYIPKKSRMLVNFWAIGRDPDVWSNNANEFFPERFIDSNLDVKGHDFELIPFGSGRRGCPGLQLGLNTVKLVVAQMMHCFNWRLPADGILSPSEVVVVLRKMNRLLRINRLLGLSCSCRIEEDKHIGFRGGFGGGVEIVTVDAVVGGAE